MKNIGQRFVLMGLVLVIGVLGGMWGADHIARGFHYNESLGEPLCWVWSHAVYPPWKVITWNDSLRPLAPKLMSEGFLFLLGGALLGFAGAAIASFSNQQRTNNENIFGDASWATHSEISESGLLQGRGVFLGVLPNGKYLRHEGPEHIAVIAPTRTGKSAGIVIPTLLTHRGSAIVYDLKEELYRATATQRSKFSDVIYLNFNSPTSHHFNPLLEIRPGIFEVRDTQNIANMVIEPDKPGMRDHWYEAANSMLVATILHLLYVGENQEKNLAGVTAFLSRADQRVNETLKEMMTTLHLRDERGKPYAPHPGVVAAARDVLNKSGDDASGVHSTIMAKLSVYRDPLLAHNTRDSDFRIDELVTGERPKSLYFIIPPADIERLRPITRLMINQICRRLTDPELSKTKEEISRRHELLLMLDEFQALGHLDFFENALAFIAGYKMRAVIMCQAMNQLKQVYGERTSILDNTAVRVFFTPSTIETADYVSRTLGQTTVDYKTRGESGKKGSLFFTGISASQHISPRALLTPREVMELPKNEAIIFVGSGKPIRSEKVRYFEDENFSRLVKVPTSFSRDNVVPLGSPWFSEKYSPINLEERHRATDETFDIEPNDDVVVVTGKAGRTNPSVEALLRENSEPKEEGFV